MSIWKDPTGRTSFGIAICARCSQKFFLDELTPDPNAPGLYVCAAVRDDFDPYRLPARQTENITLQFTRPDTPLDSEGNAEVEVIGLAIETNFMYIIATEGGAILTVET